MPPQYLAKLDQIGKSLIRWKAELKLTLGLAVIGGWVWALGLVDLWLRLERTDRLVTWGVLLALVGATLWLVRGALRLRFTPEAVAASMEKTFRSSTIISSTISSSLGIPRAIRSRPRICAPECPSGRISIFEKCEMRKRIAAD